MADDTELISGELTRMQWSEIKKALNKRRAYVNRGIREGTATQQDRIMVDAIISYINGLLGPASVVD
jgi:hypothetical protein